MLLLQVLSRCLLFGGIAGGGLLHVLFLDNLDQGADVRIVKLGCGQIHESHRVHQLHVILANQLELHDDDVVLDIL